MGGVDPDGASISCLDALDGQDNIALTVVLGSAAPKLADTKARVARMQTPTRLLLDRRDMAALIAESDLVVGAGGTSALERCALGRASVLAILADNQVNNASQLEAAGAVALIPELTPNAIRATVSPLLQNETARAAMGAAAASVCDGWGAPRVAAALCAFKTGVALRPVDRDDMEFVHRLQSEPGARRFARTPTVPPVEDHKRWFAVRLQNIADDPFHIVTLKGSRCGFVRIDRRDGALCWEVSILISERVQGQGVGHTSLGLLRLTYPMHDISAHVHPDNTASQRLFENAGYERRSEDSFFSPGWARIEQRRCHAD
ncbi:MAG: bifunctional UDP-2,4-diacetamido-2,4,6-trideoxy-beta-L-altropyranose hydrolase/GNAT family N-acetyltransferase, partial [Pseudomonadota bacterium]